MMERNYIKFCHIHARYLKCILISFTVDMIEQGYPRVDNLLIYIQTSYNKGIKYVNETYKSDTENLWWFQKAVK